MRKGVPDKGNSTHNSLEVRDAAQVGTKGSSGWPPAAVCVYAECECFWGCAPGVCSIVFVLHTWVCISGLWVSQFILFLLFLAQVLDSSCVSQCVLMCVLCVCVLRVSPCLCAVVCFSVCELLCLLNVCDWDTRSLGSGNQGWGAGGAMNGCWGVWKSQARRGKEGRPWKGV